MSQIILADNNKLYSFINKNYTLYIFKNVSSVVSAQKEAVCMLHIWLDV